MRYLILILLLFYSCTQKVPLEFRKYDMVIINVSCVREYDNFIFIPSGYLKVFDYWYQSNSILTYLVFSETTGDFLHVRSNCLTKVVK